MYVPQHTLTSSSRRITNTIANMNIQLASIMCPKRKNAPTTPRCSFVNVHGFTCPNYMKHTYNGKDVCNVHLNTLKANGECIICLTPMDTPVLRIKLACGHYFHTDCLGQCVKMECPLCRREMLPEEKKRVFTPTRIIPLFETVFNMGTSRQTIIFDMVRELIEVSTTMTDNEVDIYRAFNDCFRRGMSILNNSSILSEPTTIMFDWMTAMGSAFNHLATYGTYNGFMLQSNHSMLLSGSHPPTPLQVVPLRSNAPSPELAMSQFVRGIAPNQVAGSPSPVLPWYYN